MIIIPIKNAISKMLDLAVLYALGGRVEDQNGELIATLADGTSLSFKKFSPASDIKQAANLHLTKPGDISIGPSRNQNSEAWTALKYGDPNSPASGKTHSEAAARYFAIAMLGSEFRIPPELEKRFADWLVLTPGWRREGAKSGDQAGLAAEKQRTPIANQIAKSYSKQDDIDTLIDALEPQIASLPAGVANAIRRLQYSKSLDLRDYSLRDDDVDKPAVQPALRKLRSPS